MSSLALEIILIMYVSSKVSSNCGVIRKLRKYLSHHAFCALLNAYIFSVIDYCLIIWGPSRRTDLDSLQKKVNKLLIIFFYPSAAKFYNKGYWDVTVNLIHTAVSYLKGP
jgi:uncharacterized membrane protein YqaE (UPF0057 family)